MGRKAELVKRRHRPDRVAAAEKLPVAAVEGRLQRGKSRPELLGNHAVELLDKGSRLGDRIGQVRALGVQTVEAGLDGCVLFGRERVRRRSVRGDGGGFPPVK